VQGLVNLASEHRVIDGPYACRNLLHWHQLHYLERMTNLCLISLR
jgi:hypothetical protein